MLRQITAELTAAVSRASGMAVSASDASVSERAVVAAKPRASRAAGRRFRVSRAFSWPECGTSSTCGARALMPSQPSGSMG